MRACLIAAMWSLLITTALVSDAAAASGGKLTLYCPGTADVCNRAATEFGKHSGIAVSVLQKSAGEILAQIRAEAENPKGDVWWMGIADTHLAAGEEGLTAVHDDPAIKTLSPWARRIWQDSSGHAVGVYGLVLGFSYNTEILASRGLAAPKCWSDLIKPEYRDEIQVANPNSSGTAYAVLATMVQLMGEEPAFEYLKALHHNISDYPRSGVAPAKAAARGETAIAIGFMQDALVEKKAGFPIDVQPPCEGTGLGVDSMSVIKGGPNPQSAALFYAWALSADGQGILAKEGMMHTPANPAADAPVEARGLGQSPIIDYDFKTYGASEERARLLKRWDAEVGSLPR